jgi:formiminotetrahydrofolate cyclodeaminase
LTDQRAASIDLTVADYSFRVSTAAPTPGGGSVAGVTGALAAGLAGMVCALTLKGEIAESPRALLEPAELSVGELRLQLLDLAVEDETAYQGYRIAAALPKATPEEKTARTDALQTALIDAAEKPLMIARACFDLLVILPAIAAHGTRHALSDAAASAILAEAALRAALLNVHINTAMIKDAELAVRFRDEAARLETDAGAARAQILETIRFR